MTEKRTKWHEDIFIGITFLASSIFISFNGFTYLTSLFITNGEVVGSPTKQKGIAAFASLLEQSHWKYPLVLIFVIIAILEIKKGFKKFKSIKMTSRERKVNLYEKVVVDGTTNLLKFGFRVTESKDAGMHKYASISNDSIAFGFTYDRGHINCNAIIANGKFADIVSLANFKYFDNEMYKPFSKANSIQEREAVEYYSQIIEKELIFFVDFILNSTQESLKEFENWESTKSAEYWINVFKEKGKPIPESLKNKIKK